jgi:tetratricopeptide (TPR) repeat protein
LAANKRKILEAARRHAQKGAKEKALKEFGKLLKLDPRDSKVRLELGDTHRRWGQVAEAIEAYSSVANQFMQEGFDARAVAVFKQIQNLQPDGFSFHEPLAELYQRMGLTLEAIGCLESAAESYREAGQKQEALGLLQKMAAIDPSNTTSRIKVADLLQQEGMNDDAVSEYDAVIAELELQGDTEAAGKLFERILEIQPDRIETLVHYARNLIERGSAQRAEPLAKKALELDRSPEQYELLADIYRMENREEDLVALYRELAELYRERGDEERTREILQRHVPLEELGTSDPPNGYIDEDEKLNEGGDLDEGEDLLEDLAVGDETTLLDGDLLSDSSLLVSDDDSGLGILGDDDDPNEFSASALDLISDSNEMTSLLPDEPSGETSSGDSTDAGEEIDAAQLLAEASVYLRYGKRGQAIANLESILERDPDHRLALEKLGEALAEGDDSAKAVEMWSRAAKLAAESEETDAAEVLRTRIAALDPAAAEALDLTVATAPEPDEQLITDDLIDDPSDELSIPDDLSAPSSESGSEDLDDTSLRELDLAEVSISDVEIDIDDASFSQEPQDEEQPTGPEIELSVDDPSPIADTDLEEIDIDELLSTSEDTESGDVDIGDEDIAIDDEDSVIDDEDSVIDDEDTESEAQAVAGDAEADASPEKIAEDLEEADFYMEQGLLDEAEAAYSRILSIAPNHPHAMVRLGELASQRGDAPGPVGAATDPVGDAVDSADSVSEQSAASDIGADLANWQEDLLNGEARGAVAAEAHTPEETSDPANLEVEWVDDAGAIDGEEEGSAEEEGVAAESDLAADLGLDDPTAPDLVSAVDDGDSASAESQDETGELPVVSVEPEEPEEPEPVEVLESPVDISPEALDSEDEPAGGGDDLGFDLAAELSETFDRDPGASASGSTGPVGHGNTSEDGFASVFAEFKKGVSETLTEGDHQAHYDLGIAYREMGLLNDAATEFQLAMEAPERRVGCLHLMGMCAHDMGEPEQAIGHFTEALASDDITEETLLALKLELGKSHEAVGDIPSARRAYEEIQEIDPDFADVTARLDELAKPEEAEAQEEGNPDTEEYETFDEFLGDLDEPDVAEPDADEPEAAPDSTGDAAEAPAWETFEDVVAELDDADGADSELEEPETAASATEADDPEPAEPVSKPETTPKRRKKKISFV